MCDVIFSFFEIVCYNRHTDFCEAKIKQSFYRAIKDQKLSLLIKASKRYQVNWTRRRPIRSVLTFSKELFPSVEVFLLSLLMNALFAQNMVENENVYMHEHKFNGDKSSNIK